MKSEYICIKAITFYPSEYRSSMNIKKGDKVIISMPECILFHNGYEIDLNTEEYNNHFATIEKIRNNKINDLLFY